jgi:hypothetical protein
MVDIKREQSDPDPCSLSMEEFEDKINICDDVYTARYRVLSVLTNYERMRPNMPKTIQLMVTDFLKHEKWVDSPSSPSQSRLFKNLIGRGRRKVLNFSMWLVVAAIWPRNKRVLEVAGDMSTLWGQRFPKTRPFFPADIPEDEAHIKYEGNVAREEECPVSDADNKNSNDKNKTNKEDNGDGNEDHRSKRKSDSSDIFNKATKKQKIDRTTVSSNNGIPEPSSLQKALGVENTEQERLVHLRKTMKEKDEVIKQEDAQIASMYTRTQYTFKEFMESFNVADSFIEKVAEEKNSRDKEIRKLSDRNRTIEAKLKDASCKEHERQAYIQQLEDQIKEMQKPRQSKPSYLAMMISSFENSHDTTMDEIKVELKAGREAVATLTEKFSKLEERLDKCN